MSEDANLNLNAEQEPAAGAGSEPILEASGTSSENTESPSSESSTETPPLAESVPETDAHSHGGSPESSHSHETLDLELEALTKLEEEREDLPRPALKDLITSEDTPSRFMTVLSIGFALLACVCMGLLLTMYLKHRKAHAVKAPEVVVAPVEKLISESLGQFDLFIKSSDPKTSERELRVDIMAECSSKETCDAVKEHMAESRDLVFPVLSTATQEDFFNADVKKLMREKITDRLNSMTLPGKVNQVNFTNLTIESGKPEGKK